MNTVLNHTPTFSPSPDLALIYPPLLLPLSGLVLINPPLHISFDDLPCFSYVRPFHFPASDAKSSNFSLDSVTSRPSPPSSPWSRSLAQIAAQNVGATPPIQA